MSSIERLIPREVLFGNPTKTGPQLSPDGKRLAYMAPLDGVLNVWVGAVGSDDFKPVTHDAGRGIQGYVWAHDNTHILYIQDAGGDENWRWYSIDPATGDTRDLTPLAGVQARVVGFNKRHPNDVLVGLNDRDPQLHDVHHLDLRSGKLAKVIDNPGFGAWLIDDDLEVRGGLLYRPDGGLDIQVRDGDGWRTLIALEPDDALVSNPVGFTLDGKSLYLITSAGVNAGRLVKVNAETGDIEVEIAADPTYDVGGVTLHPDTREVQIVTIVKDRIERTVLDPSIEDDVAAITALHRGDFAIVNRNHADDTWLVAFNVDDGPIPYYAYNRKTKEATFLFVHRPELSDYTLAQMEPFSFESRDGLTVHGYLTFPPGSDRTALPTVLHPHGGPWGRDVWGFNPLAQWLANRGYLCVQIDFRGSTGYGKDFVNAGDREWAGKMHDDLIDGVEWVIGKGYADRDRVGIMGGSYGGYAALVGATFTPDVFRCAVDICGPSNLKTLIESVPPYWVHTVDRWFRTRVGNPDTEADFLWSRSPLSRVDDIKIPILVGQGANDPRVKEAEAEQIVAAMKEKGIDHEYIVFADEGHGFVRPANRLKFYAAAERFLAKHLGGRSED
jgi:dipeptidyl aminopeptidase/acylaminoacyl peptidase